MWQLLNGYKRQQLFDDVLVLQLRESDARIMHDQLAHPHSSHQAKGHTGVKAVLPIVSGGVCMHACAECVIVGMFHVCS